MSTASRDDSKDASESNTALNSLAQENLELRKELEDAQAMILKLRTENNRFATERTRALLKKATAPTPTPFLGPRSPSRSVEVLITSAPKSSHLVSAANGRRMHGESSKRPIEVLESSDGDEPRSRNVPESATSRRSITDGTTKAKATKRPRNLPSPPDSGEIQTAVPSTEPARPKLKTRPPKTVSSAGNATASTSKWKWKSSAPSTPPVRNDEPAIEAQQNDEQPPTPPEDRHPERAVTVSKNEFMEGLKNPKLKVKVKQAAVRLPDDSIYNRLRMLGAPRFTIPDRLSYAFLSATTTRKELTAQFGGSSYTLLQRVAPERTAVHGYKRFLCPMLEMNPHAPQVPGAHGLMFRSGDDDDVFGGEEGGGKVGSHKEIVLVGIGEGKWLYMGDYELQKSDSLSTEEYLSVPLKVRNDWANKILTAKSGLRARSRISIFLRKQLGREPTIAEVHAKEAAKKKDKKKKSKKSKHRSYGSSEDEAGEEVADGLSVEDIKRSYETGEEKLNVWVLKCTGYDEVFQRQLAGFNGNAVADIPPRSGASDKRSTVNNEQVDSDSDSDSDSDASGIVVKTTRPSKRNVRRTYFGSVSDLTELEYD